MPCTFRLTLFNCKQLNSCKKRWTTENIFPISETKTRRWKMFFSPNFLVYDFWPDFMKRKVPTKFVFLEIQASPPPNKKLSCSFRCWDRRHSMRTVTHLQHSAKQQRLPAMLIYTTTSLEIFLFFITKNFQKKQLSCPLTSDTLP